MNEVQILGLIFSLVGLVLSIYYKFSLDKKHYALEMIREWNHQTAKDKIIVEKVVPGLYVKCSERLLGEKLSKIYAAASLKEEELTDGEKKEDYLSAKESIVRLLNYFEFVSSAYLNKAVNKKIIRKSFSGTMLRYYCILNDYIKMEFDKTQRNPWQPYTEFVTKIVTPPRRFILHKNTVQKNCLILIGRNKLVCSEDKRLELYNFF